MAAADVAAELNHSAGAWAVLFLLIALAVYLLFLSPFIWRFLRGSIFIRKNGKTVKQSSFLTRLSYAYNRYLLPNTPFLLITNGNFIAIATYTTTVCTLLLWDNTHSWQSFLMNFKRPGMLAIAQLPPIFWFACRNSLVSWATGKSNVKLNFIHRLAGRALFIFSVLHAGQYIYVKGYLPLEGVTIITGIAGILALFLIVMTALPIVRKTLHEMFFICHWFGFICLIIALWFHTKIDQPYILISIAPFAIDLAKRFVDTRCTLAEVTSLPEGYTVIRCKKFGTWKAGQHVYCRAITGFRSSHPLTIASSSDSGELLLLAKNSGAWTKGLHSLDSDVAPPAYDLEKGGKGMDQPLTIRAAFEGPYGNSSYIRPNQHETLLLVAGGSGISHSLALLDDLLHNLGHSTVKNVHLVWTFREPVDRVNETLQMAEMKARKAGLQISISLHCTSTQKQHSFEIKGIRWFNERPDFNDNIQQALDSTTNGLGIAVCVCGPQSIISSTRFAVSGITLENSLKVGGINYHSESQ